MLQLLVARFCYVAIIISTIVNRNFISYVAVAVIFGDIVADINVVNIQVFDVLSYCYENMLPLLIATFFYVAVIISANLKDNLIFYAVVTNIYANFVVDNKVYVCLYNVYIVFIICANFCCSC